MSDKTKKLFIRNFILFTLTLVVCVTGLIYLLLDSNKAFVQSREDIKASSEILSGIEDFSGKLEAVIISHKTYELLKNEGNLETYRNNLAGALESLDILAGRALGQENDGQLNKIADLQRNFSRLKDQLNTRLENRPGNRVRQAEIDEYIGDLRSRIATINGDILRVENNRLKDNLERLSRQKDAYLNILIFGVVIGALLFILFHVLLLMAQAQRLTAEALLKENRERFKLAVEGMNDGIWDWDLKKNEIYYSAQYYQLLGYNQKETIGTPEDFSALVHPDDVDRVWEYANRYLEGRLPEFTTTFRMKNAEGNWNWIQSRGKAIFDDKGQPIRMVGVHSDITYLKEYQEFLKREKQHAEQANVAKSEFLAHMSHEIRTPLTAINGIAEIFEKNIDHFDGKYKRLIATLKNSTSSLKDLINDILDFSKIEEGEIRIEEDYFPLNSFFDQIYNITAIQANEKGIKYEFDFKKLKGLEFYGDAARLRQIIINLIGNAVKFTHEGSVKVRADDVTIDGRKYLEISVKDTGIGIPAEKLELIFERFKQSDDSISRSYGGTGLGLSISRRLASMMDGVIEVESECGKGSTFTLRVPVTRSPKININKIDQKKDDRPQRSHPQKAKPTKGKKAGHEADSDEKRVLVVEDYEGNVVVLGYLLDQLGLSFDVAVNGIEAVKKWRESDYDIILMDIQMPQMDGFTATAKIREAEEDNNLKETPIIGMTAHALVGDREKCLNAGMNAYVPKPINEEDLRAEILRLIGGTQE